MLFASLLASAALLSAASAQQPPQLPLPSASQLHYLDSELTMFMHFSVCTFNDGCDGGQQNCGYGGRSVPYPASSFNPDGLDTAQWAAAWRRSWARGRSA
jgi:alpha-L-fucosidase